MVTSGDERRRKNGGAAAEQGGVAAAVLRLRAPVRRLRPVHGRAGARRRRRAVCQLRAHPVDVQVRRRRLRPVMTPFAITM